MKFLRTFSLSFLAIAGIIVGTYYTFKLCIAFVIFIHETFPTYGKPAILLTIFVAPLAYVYTRFYGGDRSENN
ncbi:hypothetical protein [Cytobacillus sp. FSL K6-0129]|uniref:hypothetical protein n=1 Tax=Cytobacillus sp. FSL K6-0129 TaxID=2921421 RepID=UPI0030FC30BA